MLSNKLSDQYKRLAEYMAHLLVMGTAKHDANRGSVTIDTGTCIVKPVPSQKLLGINIHQSLKWKEHLLGNDKSLINPIRHGV